MRVTPRKNLRGLFIHLQSLVDRQIREEFPELAPVRVGFYATGREKTLGVRAYWQQFFHNNKVHRYVKLTAHGEKGRRFYLEADDDALVSILRHELLHGDMRRRGQPHGDSDLPFIMECLYRRIIVGDKSVKAFEKIYGTGSFLAFRAFLGPG